MDWFWSVPFLFIGFALPLVGYSLSIALVAVVYVAAASTFVGCALIFLEMVMSIELLE